VPSACCAPRAPWPPPIDLTGLHLCIGRLTASILDLDPDDGCRLRPALQGLLFDLDRLQATLEASGT